MAVKYCGNCGQEYQPGQKFCQGCGARLTQDNASPQSEKTEILRAPNQQVPNQQVPNTPMKVKKQINKVPIIIGGIILAAILIGVGAYSVFHKDTLDLSKVYSVEFNGYDGSGTYEVSDPNYDKIYAQIEGEASAALDDAIYKIDYKVDKSKKYKLKNGDEFVLNVTYNEDAFKKAGYKIKGAEVKKKVKGLTKRYKTAAEIDKDLLNKTKEQASYEAKGTGENSYYEDFKGYSLKATYWLSDKYTDPEDSADEGYYDTLLFIYELKHLDYDDKTKKAYMAVAVSPIDGKYKEGDFEERNNYYNLYDCESLAEAIVDLKREDNLPESKYIWSEVK